MTIKSKLVTIMSGGVFMGFLKGKTAIITGGGRAVLQDGSCGSIGYGIATAYAKEGANLVLTFLLILSSPILVCYCSISSYYSASPQILQQTKSMFFFYSKSFTVSGILPACSSVQDLASIHSRFVPSNALSAKLFTLSGTWKVPVHAAGNAWRTVPSAV